MIGNATFINKITKKSMKYQKSLVLFHSMILSSATQQAYDKSLEKFRDYFKIRDFDSLLTIDSQKTQEMVEDWVMSLKSRNLRATSIRPLIAGVELFYVSNDMILNWKKTKKMIKDDRKAGNDKAYTRLEIKSLLEKLSNVSHKSAILFFASSGCRAGSITELRVCDVQDIDNGCKSVRVYADTKDEYYTFLTPEASDYLEKHLGLMRSKGKIASPNSLIFRMNPVSLSTTLCKISKDLRGKKIGQRYEVATLHGLRKFFDTVLKSNLEINPNIAEKLTGHSRTFRLDNVYFKPDLDTMFKEYQKAIPDLTITDEYRLRLELEEKSIEIKNLESKDKRIEDLEKRLSELYVHLNNIMPKVLQ